MANLDENRIRQIVQEEVRRNESAGRFGFRNIPNHTHNGLDSLAIKQDSIIPAASITGTITIDTATTYTLNLNASFTPQIVTVDGVLTGTSPVTGQTARVHVVGSALLTPSFYLEENRPDGQATANTTVDTLDLQFPFNGKPAQESSFLWVVKSGSNNEAYAGASRDHLVSVFYGTDSSTSDDVARVTLTQFSKNSLTLEVPVLVSGWTIFLNVNIS